jgi:hypothetical protein
MATSCCKTQCVEKGVLLLLHQHSWKFKGDGKEQVANSNMIPSSSTPLSLWVFMFVMHAGWAGPTPLFYLTICGFVDHHP